MKPAVCLQSGGAAWPWAACAASLGVCMALAGAGDLRGRGLVWGVGALALAASAALLGRWVGRSGAHTPRWHGVLAAAALAPAWVLALAGQPSLSDDVHRYMWEGRAQRVAFAAPYLWPPSSPRIPDTPPGSRARVAHPEVSAAYPPVAELLLRGGAAGVDATGWGLHAWLLLLACVHTATCGLLWRAAAPSQKAAVAAFALHPLALLEGPLGGHLDGIMALALCLAVMLLQQGRPGLAGVALGLAVGIKPWPLLLVPWLLLQRRRWPALVGMVAVLVASVVPYLPAGWALGAGLAHFAAHWEFHGALHPVARWALAATLQGIPPWHVGVGDGLALAVGPDVVWHAGPLVHVAWLQVDARLLAKAVGAAAVLAACGWALRRWPQQPDRYLWVAGTALLAASPTVHPWYALPLLPLCVLAHARASLWGLGALLAAYSVWQLSDTGVTWVPDPRTAWLSWLVVLGTAAADLRRWARPANATQDSPATIST